MRSKVAIEEAWGNAASLSWWREYEREQLPQGLLEVGILSYGDLIAVAF